MYFENRVDFLDRTMLSRAVRIGFGLAGGNLEVVKNDLDTIGFFEKILNFLAPYRYGFFAFVLYFFLFYKDLTPNFRASKAER